jgi:hypothetical protein
VKIQNTRTEQAPFVRYQDQTLDGERAMVMGNRQGNSVQLNIIRGSQLIYLPAHFLIPEHPTRDNQTVVVLEGEKKGQAYKTIKVPESTTHFKLSPIHLRKRKGELMMEASKLVVADYKPPPL